jgi:hypothetical protein
METKPATARSRPNSAPTRRPDGWVNAAKEINTSPATSKAKAE